MKPEERIEKYLVSQVKEMGGQCYKFEGRKGVPDRVVLLPGRRPIFVECKAPGKKMRPLQVKVAQDIKALGNIVHCVDSLEGVDYVLSRGRPCAMKTLRGQSQNISEDSGGT